MSEYDIGLKIRRGLSALALTTGLGGLAAACSGAHNHLARSAVPRDCVGQQTNTWITPESFNINIARIANSLHVSQPLAEQGAVGPIECAVGTNTDYVSSADQQTLSVKGVSERCVIV